MSHHLQTPTAFILALVPALLLLANCGGGSSTPALAGSCQNTAGGFCVEYTGADYKAMKMPRICEGQKLVFLTDACPTEGRVGSCLSFKGKNSESTFRYYNGFPGFGVKPVGGVAAAAESQCATLKGEWLAN